MNIYRLGQLADQLHVSIDWLFGRTSIMELPARFSAEEAGARLGCDLKRLTITLRELASVVVRYICVHEFEIEEALRIALKVRAGVPGTLVEHNTHISWDPERFDVFDPGLGMGVLEAGWRSHGNE
ncbi:MAG: hypothetical protein ACLQF2_09600, partial [Rhodomicrobium sp.]